uniref:CREG-like beta-barrel domain-containing protein n=1 Tax=Latimeria chalumnae TaxID=7897 RepID=H2ZU95_LATCH
TALPICGCLLLALLLGAALAIPPHDQVAKVARYVAHSCDWGSLATISVQEVVRGWPFANVFSVSDGPLEQGTGVPYFYLSPLEISVHDLKVSCVFFFF